MSSLTLVSCHTNSGFLVENTKILGLGIRQLDWYLWKYATIGPPERGRPKEVTLPSVSQATACLCQRWLQSPLCLVTYIICRISPHVCFLSSDQWLCFNYNKLDRSFLSPPWEEMTKRLQDLANVFRQNVAGYSWDEPEACWARGTWGWIQELFLRWEDTPVRHLP